MYALKQNNSDLAVHVASGAFPFTGLSWTEHRSWRAFISWFKYVSDFGSNGPGIPDFGICPLFIRESVNTYIYIDRLHFYGAFLFDCSFFYACPRVVTLTAPQPDPRQHACFALCSRLPLYGAGNTQDSHRCRQ